MCANILGRDQGDFEVSGLLTGHTHSGAPNLADGLRDFSPNYDHPGSRLVGLFSSLFAKGDDVLSPMTLWPSSVYVSRLGSLNPGPQPPIIACKCVFFFFYNYHFNFFSILHGQEPIL